MSLKGQDDLVVKVEKAREQIARLREQQTDLERERAELEDLRGKQEEWIRGKKEMGDAILKALALLEKEESETTRMAELVRTSRSALTSIFDDLKAVKEEKWSSSTLKEDLAKALVIIRGARKELDKARARIPALDEKRGDARPLVALPESPLFPGRSGTPGAGELVRIGFWLALPFAIMILAIVLLLALV